MKKTHIVLSAVFAAIFVMLLSFTVSASAVLADHLAFTIAFAPSCLTAVIAGKLISGVLAVLLAGRARV